MSQQLQTLCQMWEWSCHGCVCVICQAIPLCPSTPTPSPSQYGRHTYLLRMPGHIQDSSSHIGMMCSDKLHEHFQQICAIDVLHDLIGAI